MMMPTEYLTLLANDIQHQRLAAAAAYRLARRGSLRRGSLRRGSLRRGSLRRGSLRRRAERPGCTAGYGPVGSERQ
jgi:hypothetical protein